MSNSGSNIIYSKRSSDGYVFFGNRHVIIHIMMRSMEMFGIQKRMEMIHMCKDTRWLILKDILIDTS